ncbi:MAG: type II toxin-antitoxin system RelB/DinJ family antitoxin [Defluviitaleaceae bacterium]|nr:type II toxin-antitoxin system RelB/DinJ family antitoxin [Defluviitaleaceae bacterium]
MKTVEYNLMVDPKIKAEAEEIFGGLGLKLSDAINVFLHKSIIHYGFPFEVAHKRPNAELLAAMAEANQIIAEHKAGTRKGYATAAEMHAAILAEEDAPMTIYFDKN